MRCSVSHCSVTSSCGRLMMSVASWLSQAQLLWAGVNGGGMVNTAYHWERRFDSSHWFQVTSDSKHYSHLSCCALCVIRLAEIYANQLFPANWVHSVTFDYSRYKLLWSVTVFLPNMSDVTSPMNIESLSCVQSNCHNIEYFLRGWECVKLTLIWNMASAAFVLKDLEIQDMMIVSLHTPSGEGC